MSEVLDVATPDLSGPPADAPVPVPADPDSGSLANHEAAHSPNRVESDEDEPAKGDRDASGRFQKPRRRAASQQADADDVPAIHEQTKRLKALEETHGKDIVRKDGESERVYQLRRRADLLERLNQTPAPTPTLVTHAAPSARPPVNLPATFPAYEAFITIPGNEDATYDDYRDVREDWRYQVRRQSERQQDAAETAQRTYQERGAAHLQRVAEARKKYPDFDTHVTADLPVSRVVGEAVLASKDSAEVAYLLGKNRSELAALNAESQDYSPSAVAAMRRYLDTLVAPQRSSPQSNPVAAPTRSALALAPSPAPRPPNLVRTSASTPADEPPDADDQSLHAHEKHYGPRARR